MLPQLPPDIWYRIAGFSPQETLSALSEVSKTLNKVVTHTTLYTPQISHTHLHPAQAFRREAALHHPPTTIIPILINVTRIYQAKDTALLYHSSTSSLIAFPTRHVFPLRHAHHQIRLTSYVPLFDELIAFVTVSGRDLCTFDLSTGHVKCIPLLERTTVVPICRRVVLAGNRGQWLVQRTNHKFFVTDRHTGEPKHEYHIPDHADTILVKGEFSRAHNGTCVGYATTTLSAGVKTVHVHGFDGINTTFQVSEQVTVESVLRSEDTLTHLLVTRQMRHLPKHFIASRGSMLWYGDLNDMERPILGNNGTSIMESKQVSLSLRTYSFPDTTLCVMLNHTGKQAWTERVFMKRVSQSAEIVWMRRIRDCTFTLAIGRQKDKLELIKVSCENGRECGQVLNYWVIPRVTHVRVIADHYILATTRSQKLHLIHFDRLCNGAGGVHVCPLDGLFNYGYLPGQFREGEDVSREGKRKQFDDGMLDAMKWV